MSGEKPVNSHPLATEGSTVWEPTDAEMHKIPVKADGDIDTAAVKSPAEAYMTYQADIEERRLALQKRMAVNHQRLSVLLAKDTSTLSDTEKKQLSSLKREKAKLDRYNDWFIETAEKESAEPKKIRTVSEIKAAKAAGESVTLYERWRAFSGREHWRIRADRNAAIALDDQGREDAVRGKHSEVTHLRTVKELAEDQANGMRLGWKERRRLGLYADGWVDVDPYESDLGSLRRQRDEARSLYESALEAYVEAKEQRLDQPTRTGWSNKFANERDRRYYSRCQAEYRFALQKYLVAERLFTEFRDSLGAPVAVSSFEYEDLDQLARDASKAKSAHLKTKKTFWFGGVVAFLSAVGAAAGTAAVAATLGASMPLWIAIGVVGLIINANVFGREVPGAIASQYGRKLTSTRERVKQGLRGVAMVAGVAICVLASAPGLILAGFGLAVLGVLAQVSANDSKTEQLSTTEKTLGISQRSWFKLARAGSLSAGLMAGVFTSFCVPDFFALVGVAGAMAAASPLIIPALMVTIGAGIAAGMYYLLANASFGLVNTKNKAAKVQRFFAEVFRDGFWKGALTSTLFVAFMGLAMVGLAFTGMAYFVGGRGLLEKVPSIFKPGTVLEAAKAVAAFLTGGMILGEIAFVTRQAFTATYNLVNRFLIGAPVYLAKKCANAAVRFWNFISSAWGGTARTVPYNPGFSAPTDFTQIQESDIKDKVIRGIAAVLTPVAIVVYAISTVINGIANGVISFFGAKTDDEPLTVQEGALVGGSWNSLSAAFDPASPHVHGVKGVSKAGECVRKHPAHLTFERSVDGSTLKFDKTVETDHGLFAGAITHSRRAI